MTMKKHQAALDSKARTHFEAVGEEGLRGITGEIGALGYADYILRTLYPPAGAKVVDLGCGDGHVLNAIAQNRPDLKCRGVDFAASKLEQARTESAHLSNVNYLWADLKDDLPDMEAADLVYSFSVIQYFTPDEFVALNQRIRKCGLLASPGAKIFHLSIPDLLKRPFLFHVAWLDQGSPTVWKSYIHMLQMSLMDLKRRITDDRRYGGSYFHDPNELECLTTPEFNVKINRPSDSWYRFDICLIKSGDTAIPDAAGKV